MRNLAILQLKNSFLPISISAILVFFTFESNAQQKLKVLFLGNSYTGVNNLPLIIKNVALSVGDTLNYDSNTPGGYQLIGHSQNATSQSKIMAGGWQYVVIQGQSQEPIAASQEFNSGGNALYNQIKQYNPCAVVMPYMTWGRKNGDASNCASFPVMCTYLGMDSTLRNRYLGLAKSLNGEVSPVSVVWNYLRQNHPGIELYQTDESHPSAAGSYAAACCFYTSLFKKDPGAITYNFGLNSDDANNIRNAVRLMVFNQLPLWNFKKLPISNFRYEIGNGVNEVVFISMNQGVRQSSLWNFGDGNTSSATNPTHSYVSNGTYTVSLTASNCDLQGLHSSTKDTVIQFCSHTPIINTTNPWLCNFDTLWTQSADSYQWYSNQIPIPETSRYLPYYQYQTGGFSVRTTVNGCSELSKRFTESPVWSGYYFDALGDPCMGDTVAFAVLHTNGFLSGSESIKWYKNDTLLPQMNNMDTLLVTGSGKYECRVIKPNSGCPFDTTKMMVTYSCGVVGTLKIKSDVAWKIFPNPASETITIQSNFSLESDKVRIFNVWGRLTKELSGKDAANLDISNLPSGLYFISLKSNNQTKCRFVKL